LIISESKKTKGYSPESETEFQYECVK